MEEKVIFEVDVTSLSKAVLQAQADLNSYNIALQDSIELNGKFSEESTQAKAAVDAQSKAVKQAEGALLRVTQAEKALGGSLKDIVKNYDATNKSIDQNRKVLNALNAEYVKTVNPSKELTARIKGISDALKQQEGAIGDTRRNVGNYFNEFAQGIPGLGAAIEPLKNIGGAFKNVGINAAGFQAAFLAGIPLIIGGLQGAFSIAQKFDSVVEGLEDTTMGLNRAFDDLIANGNKPFTSFSQLYQDLKNSYEAGVQLSQVMRQLEEAQDFQRVNNATASRDVEKLIIQSKDRTKTDLERIALLDEASKKEKENLEENIKLAEERGRLATAELARVISAGLNDDKQKKAVNDANVALIELQRESGNLQEKILNRRNQLLDEIQKKEEKQTNESLERRQKELDERRKAFQEEKRIGEERMKQSAEIDNANKDKEAKRIAALTNEFNTEQQFLEKQLQLDLGYVDLSVASEEDKFKRKQEIQIQSLEKQLDLAIQFLGADGSITKTELQGIEAIRLALAKAKAQTFATTKNANGEKETFGSALGIDKESLKSASEGLAVAQNVISGISEIASAATQIRLNEIESEKQAEIDKVNQSTLSEEAKAKKIAAINAEADAEKREAEKSAFETNKALQIVNAIIGTAVGVVNAFQLGPIAGAIMAAVIAATGAAQIAVIASQQPPKFATGVIGLDGEGTETSDSIDARLSKGESVMTAKATKRYHRELAAMEWSVGNKPNYQFGNKRFATGFIPQVSSDGGFTARETMKQSDLSVIMREAIKSGFAAAPAPKLSIVELESKQKDRNRSVKVSEL